MNDDILSDWDNFDLDNNAEVIKVNNKINSEIGVIQDSPFHDYGDVEIVIEDTGITEKNGIQIGSNGETILNDNISDSLCPPLDCKPTVTNMPEFREIPDLCFCPVVEPLVQLGIKTVVVSKNTDNLEFSIDEFLTKKNCEG